MIIDCVSDLHGYFPKLEGGDLLIIAGDLTARDTDEEHLDFILWLAETQKSDKVYKKIIYISGNHDNFLHDKKRYGQIKTKPDWNIVYLCDSGTEFEGLKIWGCPHSLWFHGVNPRCKAFMGSEKDLKKRYDLIPNNIDILITHTPPYGILDENIDGKHCGSSTLRDALDRVKPKLLVCGHIHELGGKEIMYKHQGPNTWCVNASYVNERYQPVNNPVRIIF